MAKATEHDEAGKKRPETMAAPAIRDDELERRRRELDATLAARRGDGKAGSDGGKPANNAGYGQALKLSSEFIAGVLVGGGLGWVIDRWAGISPWGLIVFLLLGFGAGVLNVMRTAGLVADAGIRTLPKGSDGTEEK